MYNDSSLSSSSGLVGTISLDRNDQEVIGLSFVLPGLHLNTLETEKMLQFGGENILDVRLEMFPSKLTFITETLAFSPTPLISRSFTFHTFFSRHTHNYKKYSRPTFLHDRC